MAQTKLWHLSYSRPQNPAQWVATYLIHALGDCQPNSKIKIFFSQLGTESEQTFSFNRLTPFLCFFSKLQIFGFGFCFLFFLFIFCWIRFNKLFSFNLFFLYLDFYFTTTTKWKLRLISHEGRCFI